MGGCADEQRARLMFDARGKTEQMTQKGPLLHLWEKGLGSWDGFDGLPFLGHE